ncbi:MAG: hypothetical protein NZ955_00740 [Candidatus Bathyarchaeota archaeon]|nr:hypothetical protein [Candidatus Bathyarchaeota archaeon]MCX8161949.1 hypothetical protein [Candidatus Bathyarchaeota archaeon]
MSKEEAEEVERILSAVSSQVPSLIKGIIASIFSEEAGREMGRAAGAFYKSLIESGIPEQTALKMTEDYLSIFTDIGRIVRRLRPEEGK